MRIDCAHECYCLKSWTNKEGHQFGALLTEARALNINISRACEAGLAKAVADVQAAQWLRDNAEALTSSNGYVDKQGIPLAQYRQF